MAASSSVSPTASDPRAVDWLGGGGEMGTLIRAMDWARTPLGPIESWPQSLRSAVSILLPSRAQIAMFWGPDLITLYNDAYRPVLGAKHPRALGLPVREVWSELWGAGLRELFEGVLTTGEAFWASDRPFFMERYGFTEETFFDISYDPVRDETGRVGGLFCIVSDTTARVVGERRLRTLRDLSASATAEAKSVEEACRSAALVLSQNRYDLPFTLIYLLDSSGRKACCVGASGLAEGGLAAPLSIDLTAPDPGEAGWPLRVVLESNRGQEVADLLSRFGPLPGGEWPEPPHTAVVLPISASGQDRAAGFLVAGVSPRRPLDDQYRGFLGLLAGQVATTIANARAHEEEKRRAEALAELDRAKTAFFSNVSHEFRTPLTLILGPVEDLLVDPGNRPTPRQQERLDIAHRNGLRLQKLVNTLLDFSRIEAGRAQASYVPTDLAALTAELASNFRSACERAGLELVVDCPPLPEPVYVDRDMWEKIVLNLVSNAFKFTLEGRIEVRLRAANARVELAVRDTGAGIPEQEMPKLFERFHRVEGCRGRTQEGSGIGLALVRELVKLHGGDVRAESTHGVGSVFTVSLPLGKDHLPADRISAGRTLVSTALGASPYIEEALRWLPDSPALPPARSSAVGVDEARDDALTPQGGAAGDRCRILLADDNADMRDYVRRLLGERYDVKTVADGQAAWDSAREAAPDLVLADVMMPGLDGFGLLRRLRADPRTREVPVILLSARAGEEARVEGMEAGADDYLVKPFSARELLARVDAHVKMAKLRREGREALRASEERYRRLVGLLPVGVYTCEAPSGLITFYNQQAAALWGRAPQLGETDERFCGSFRLWRPDGTRLPHYQTPMALAVREGRSCRNQDVVIERPDGSRISVLVNIDPIFDAQGRVVGAVNAFHDTTSLKSAQEQLRRSEEHLRAVVETTPACIKVVAADGTLLDMNAAGLAMVEADGLEQVQGKPVYHLIGAEDRDSFRAFHERVCRGEKGDLEFEVVGLRGTRRRMESHAAPLRGPDGSVRQLAVTQDITERRRAEEAVHALNARLAADLEVMTRMHRVSTRLLQAGDFDALLSEILDAAIEITGSDMGNIQLLDGGVLRIVVQRGFEQPFLDFFNAVHDGLAACGTAMQAGGRVIVEDVANSPIFAGSPALEVMLGAGARAVQSTPLVSRSGRVVGMFSTHWRRAPHRPAERELFMLDLLARQAADLIERRQAEEALRESEQRYRQLFESMDEGYCVIEVRFDAQDQPVDYRFLDINPAFEKQTGLKDARGKWMRELAPHHEQHWFDIYGRVVRTGETVRFENEAAALGRWYDVCAFRIGAAELRRVGIVFNDITDRRRSQEALKEADRRKDEFLATLAHELRNPLAPIRNALQLVRLAAGDPAMLEQAHSLMDRQVQQMVRLVDDLLDVSRISRNKLELRKEWVELSAVVQSAVETSRPLIERERHALQIALPPPPVLLDADPVRLAQVFANLLNNSAKYTEANGKIDVTAEVNDGEVLVRVRDTGVGIPADKLPHVFDMFVQVDRSLERSHGGLGIGLTLVKRLVEMHGGGVEVRSDGPGKGSEFTVRLPVVPVPRPQGPQERTGDGRAAVVRRRVLVADDNRDAADSLALILKLLGHEVVTAHDGLQAVEVEMAFQPEVAVLDVGMPRLNGYDTARRLRERRGPAGIVLVALTGWGQEEDRRRSREAGFDHHLVKPVDLATLERILAELERA